jgi:hypothetical protein
MMPSGHLLLFQVRGKPRPREQGGRCRETGRRDCSGMVVPCMTEHIKLRWTYSSLKNLMAKSLVRGSAAFWTISTEKGQKTILEYYFHSLELSLGAVRHPRRRTASATREHPKREEDAQDAPFTSPPAHHVSCPVPMMILHKSSLSHS